MHFQIYSEYDGWSINALEGNELKWSYCWNHNDAELGIGGEKLFADILKALGHTVYEEDVC